MSWHERKRFGAIPLLTLFPFLAVSLGLGCGQAPTPKGDPPINQEDKKVKPSANTDAPETNAEEVVKAWKKAGADVGWMRVNKDGYFAIVTDTDGKPGEVRGFHFRDWQDGRLTKLPAPAEPFGLDLSYEATDVGLKELAAFRNLQSLNLAYAKVTDAGFKELASLKNLQMLNLKNTEVTNEGLKVLSGFNLHLLYLPYKVTDAGLKEVSNFKNLHTLILPYQVTDAGLKEVGGLTALEMLRLEKTKVTDAGLKELARLQNLQTLELVETELTGTGLKDLSGLKNLHNLNLEFSRMVDDVGLKEVAALKGLQTLNLSDTHVTDAGVQALQKALPACKITR